LNQKTTEEASQSQNSRKKNKQQTAKAENHQQKARTMCSSVKTLKTKDFGLNTSLYLSRQENKKGLSNIQSKFS